MPNNSLQPTPRAERFESDSISGAAELKVIGDNNKFRGKAEK